MDWPTPEWAHIPLIHGPDGAKLSKRHGALGVEAYRAMGYLPEALRNYLARLGWSHGDDEIFSSEQAAEWFDLGDINKGPARFDFAKLQSVNGHYIRTSDDAELLAGLEAILPELPGGPAFTARLDAGLRGRLLALMPALKERAKTLVDLFEAAAFLAAERPLALDEKASALLDADSRALVGRVAGRLAETPWSAAELEAAVRSSAEAEGVKLGRIAQPMRAALTGRAASPPLFEVMAALGREESLARLADQAA
jgi:glutamyl-tRNA synthetase